MDSDTNSGSGAEGEGTRVDWPRSLGTELTRCGHSAKGFFTLLYLFKKRKKRESNTKKKTHARPQRATSTRFNAEL